MYYSDAYNSLPSLRSAASLIDDTYGVVLLHKHFHIKDVERLVECRHSSTAWKVGKEMDVVPQYQGVIAPRSFRLYNSAAVPYEFAYSTKEPHFNVTFETGALKMLENIALDQIFGLRHLDEHDPSLSVKITEGKTNIMMDRGSIPESELIEALWIFSNNEDNRCHCREHCWPTKDGHDKDHSCG
ncbi:hypothetical protein P154DRAFT_580630 [Amniculicola lignicola CBS 123094]|uniref:Uncharacterized protein n=1 Tax=Amniculicola lignicola CBS 123094 TaxID=1392246 RepID=A0A6A5W402_9PLEO|nr:hypothetical protein P154DRAFT_580630 [Amniculicola lignicola CBS 123094]